METLACKLGVSVDSLEAAIAQRNTEATSFAEKVPIPPAGGFAGDLRAKILQSLAIANDRQSAGQ